jgi:hypothetical protein
MAERFGRAIRTRTSYSGCPEADFLEPRIWGFPQMLHTRLRTVPSNDPRVRRYSPPIRSYVAFAEIGVLVVGTIPEV